MSFGWFELTGCCLYFSALIALARFGERAGWVAGPRLQTLIYVLGCCAHTSSWMFFGFIEIASTKGLTFLPIMASPIIVYGLCHRLVARIATLVKAQNINSIADFVGARYGKAAPVAALVTVLSTIAGITFVAFQIKLIAASLTLVMQAPSSVQPAVTMTTGFLPVVIAILIAVATMAMGTQSIDATEHRRGLALVVAVDAGVRLITFLIIGCAIIWGLFHGLSDLAARVTAEPAFEKILTSHPPVVIIVLMITVGTVLTVLWPQQFHMTFVENRDIRAIRQAAWVVPLYFFAFALFVLPLAIASHAMFPEPVLNHEMSILALPTRTGSRLLTFVALLGGLSATTALTFVTLTVLSIMLTNDFALPLALRIPALRERGPRGLSPYILNIRRAAIILSVGLSYVCFCMIGEAALETAVNLSVTCILQIAPACFGGLIWRRATKRGALASLFTGALTWAYTIFLPVFAPRFDFLANVVTNGPFGIKALRPTALFGLQIEPTGHAVIVTMSASILAFIGFSLSRPVTARERQQADLFIQTHPEDGDPTRSDVTIAELEATVAQYVGDDLSRQSFSAYQAKTGVPLAPGDGADRAMLLFGEHLIASVVGAASSQLIVSLLARRNYLSQDETRRLVEQVSAETQSNRDFLKRAIGLADQGMAFFDRDLRLVAWNQGVLDIFGVPEDDIQIGASIESLILLTAKTGFLGQGDIDSLVRKRQTALLNPTHDRIVSRKNGRIYDERVVRVTDVGLFVIYSDATDQAKSEEELAAANEMLERRVRERTEELEHLNAAYAIAKAEAEEANLSKTRFLAAASHDLLQPLNAARLYTASLLDKMHVGQTDESHQTLASSVGASLEAVEDILTALLDISRLDAGAMETEVTSFQLRDILDQLKMDFQPITREKGLRLTIVSSSVAVVSDRRMLRRMIQNLVSNAIKYTAAGRVIVGVRRVGDHAEIQVWDTGLGIPKARQQEIFQEFKRLPSAALVASGVGLGLSIVERLGRVLEHRIHLRSKPGKGSVFSVTVPRAAGFASTENETVTPSDPKRVPLPGLTIAIIDNEPTIVSGLSILLEGWGCRVVAGLNFAEINTALRREGARPDVIIADYHLGDSDGIAAIGALRAHYGPCHALLATADRDALVRERASREDIRLFHKPLKPAALRALLSQWQMFKDVAE